MQDLIARARLWYEQLIDGTVPSVSQLATLHNISPRYINKIFRLASLSPQSVETLLTRPESLPLSLDELIESPHGLEAADSLRQASASLSTPV